MKQVIDGIEQNFSKLKNISGSTVNPATEETLLNVLNNLNPSAGGYIPTFDYDNNGNVIYIGQAVPGSIKSASVWQIKKLVYDGNGNVTDIQYADSVTTFTKIWNNRASYSYG